MFTKVLIADDIDFNDLGAAQILRVKCRGTLC
jgi:hypothetical protein